MSGYRTPRGNNNAKNRQPQSSRTQFQAAFGLKDERAKRDTSRNLQQCASAGCFISSFPFVSFPFLFGYVKPEFVMWTRETVFSNTSGP